MCGNPSNRHSQLHGALNVEVKDHQRIHLQGTTVGATFYSSPSHSLSYQWCLLVMILSIYFIFLWCDPITAIAEGLLCVSHDFFLCLHFPLWPIILPSSLHIAPPSFPLLIWPFPFVSLQHPFLSSLFTSLLAIPLHFFSWKWKLISLYSLRPSITSHPVSF